MRGLRSFLESTMDIAMSLNASILASPNRRFSSIFDLMSLNYSASGSYFSSRSECRIAFTESTIESYAISSSVFFFVVSSAFFYSLRRFMRVFAS